MKILVYSSRTSLWNLSAVPGYTHLWFQDLAMESVCSSRTLIWNLAACFTIRHIPVFHTIMDDIVVEGANTIHCRMYAVEKNTIVRKMTESILLSLQDMKAINMQHVYKRIKWNRQDGRKKVG